MGSERERPIEACPACGRTDFSGEYGIGFHLTRYCENASEDEQEFGRSLMSGENHPMTGHEMSEEAKQAISEANRGKELPDETKEKISKSLQGHEISEETRQKISKSLQGENNPWYGVTGADHPLWNYEWSEEQREQLSEASSGENAPWYGVTGEDHPWYGVTGEDHPLFGYEWSEEQLEQLSEAHKGQLSGGTDQITVEKTGHTVRSGWEAEIDEMLFENNIEYRYEGRTFDLGEYTYTPDFVCDRGAVIEVKGYIWDGDQQKARDFMERYPELSYLIVGSELPGDYHLSWEERESLPELIQTVQKTA